MGIKDSFLNEVHIGNRIEVIIGPKTIIGKIISLDIELVKIKKDDQKIANVALEQIAYYEVIENNVLQEDKKLEISNVISQDAETKKNDKVNQNEIISENNEKSINDINDLFANVEADYQISYENLYKTYFKSIESEIKNSVDRSNNMICYAKKVNEYNIDSDRVKKAINELAQISEETNNYVPYILIGGIYSDFEILSESRGYFTRGYGFKELFYAETNEEDTREALRYAILATKNKTQDLFMTKWLCNYAKRANQIVVIELLCSQEIAYKLDILLYWYNGTEQLKRLPNKSQLDDEINLSYLLDILENDCRGIDRSLVEEYEWNEINSNPVITKKNDDELTGVITKFDKNQKWGFIDNSLYFYITQVYDKKLQEKLLIEPNNKYPVKYILGKNLFGNIAADRIELLDLYLEEKHNGFIEYYTKHQEYGKIIEGNKSYGFVKDAVIDPFLRADIESSLATPDRSIEFKLKEYKGKKVAYDILSTENYDEKLINGWVNQEYLISKEVEDWKKRNSDTKNINTYDYKELEPYVEEYAQNSNHYTLIDNEKGIDFLTIRKESTSTYGRGFCVKAHNYLVNGDLSKAEELYVEALRANEKIETTVPDLNATYMRTNQVDKSIALLDAYSDLLKREVYVNLKIQTLTKAKKNIEELLDLYNEAYDSTEIPAKKLHYLLQMAQIYIGIERYEDALEYFEKWEVQKKKNNHALLGKYDVSNIYILRGKALANYKLGKTKEAQKFASEVLKTRPNDVLATSIIRNEDISVLTENEIVWDDSWRDAKISKYMLNILQEFNLELENDLDVEDGVYVGTEEDAVKGIQNIKKRKTANKSEKASNHFAMAKVVKQMLDREGEIKDNKVINEQQFNIYIAKGMLFLADSKLSDSMYLNNYDTVRFFYLQVTNVFKDVDKIYSSWLNGFLRYMQTYSLDLDNYRKSTTSAHEDSVNELIQDLCKEFNENIKLDYREFTVSLILLFSNNANNRKYGKTVLNCLEKSKICNCIKEELNKIIKYNRSQDHSEILSNDQTISNKWNDATNAYLELQDEFGIINKQQEELVFLQKPSLIEKIENHDFLNLANETEKIYFNNAIAIFKKITKYEESEDFDVKDNLIKEIEQDVRKLKEDINSAPTLYTYEVLLEILNELEGKIYQEASILYGNARPDINIKVSNDKCSFDSESKIIYVPIEFENKINVQYAENVRIKIEIPEKNAKLINEDEIKTIKLIKGDGRAESRLLKFKITDNIVDLEVLEFSVQVIYRYKKNLNLDTDNKQDDDYEKKLFSVPLYDQNEFEQIKNEYTPYSSGSPVIDKAMFFGRENDIDEIVEQMMEETGSIKKGKGLALYGQTRTGKSSLLYHLENRLRELDHEHNIIINIDSMGDLDLHDQDITDLLYTILRALKKELQQKCREYHVDNCNISSDKVGSYLHEELYLSMRKENYSIDPEKLLEEKENAQLLFNSMFKDFCEYIEELDRKYNIILMIDEFTYIYDYIRQGKMDERITKFWKALLQNNGIYAVIIGQDHMMQFVNNPSYSNDFQTTELRKVTYLKMKDAKELMSKPIMFINAKGEEETRYKGSALDRLFELTSGSAFLIMNICKNLVDYLNEQKAKYITRAHIDDFLKINLPLFEESKFFEPQYNDKSEADNTTTIQKNKAILLKIARLSYRNEWANIKKMCEDKETDKLIEKLVERDVLLRKEGDRCKIKVALYKEWLLEKFGLEG